MQTYFWLLSLLESWDFYRCSCYHTFEVISPRISKKSLLSSSTECIKGIYNPFCRDFARTLDIGRRKSSLSKNGLFTVCCYKNAYKYNITYILTYFTLRTGKTMKLQKKCFDKKSSFPETIKPIVKRTQIKNNQCHSEWLKTHKSWNDLQCMTKKLCKLSHKRPTKYKSIFFTNSIGVKLFIFR